MKKATAILLSSVIFASLLCSCGKSADSSAVSSAVSTKTTSPTAAPTEAPTPEPTQQPAGQPASQLFSKVTGFSREWQDGKHVINGLDTSGNKICGIIDGGGNTVLMDGYTALYPLADGHLIAATDENVSGECVYTGRTMELSTAGFMDFDDDGIVWTFSGGLMWKISFGPDDDLGENRVLKMVFNYGINGITCNFFEHDTYTSNYMSFSEFPYLQNYGTYFSCLDPYNSSCFIVGGRAFNPASESTYLLPWSAFPSDALDCTAINTWQDTLANEVSNSKISFLGSDSSGLGYFCRTIYPDMMLRDSTKTYFTAAGDEIDIPQNYMDALESVNLLDNKFLLTLKGADGKTYFTLLDLADGSTFAPVLIPDSPQVVAQNGSVLAICSPGKSFRIYSVENGTELDTFDISESDGYRVDDIFFSGNYLIICCYDDSNEDFLYHVYSLNDGALII